MFGILQLPNFLEEREKILTLTAKLEDRNAIQAKMKFFLDNFKNGTDLLKADIAKREKLIAENAFQCQSESKIPEFINGLQQLFADSGASIINLGYERREKVGDLVVLPFIAEFRAPYQGMRKAIHALETNMAGIRIDSLNFLSLNDEEHMIKINAKCSVRFKSVGQ